MINWFNRLYMIMIVITDNESINVIIVVDKITYQFYDDNWIWCSDYDVNPRNTQANTTCCTPH